MHKYGLKTTRISIFKYFQGPVPVSEKPVPVISRKSGPVPVRPVPVIWGANLTLVWTSGEHGKLRNR